MSTFSQDAIRMLEKDRARAVKRRGSRSCELLCICCGEVIPRWTDMGAMVYREDRVSPSFGAVPVVRTKDVRS